jgi:hypothetical protein
MGLGLPHGARFDAAGGDRPAFLLQMDEVDEVALAKFISG